MVDATNHTRLPDTMQPRAESNTMVFARWLSVWQPDMMAEKPIETNLQHDVSAAAFPHAFIAVVAGTKPTEVLLGPEDASRMSCTVTVASSRCVRITMPSPVWISIYSQLC